jgi:hypothetical protein
MLSSDLCPMTANKYWIGVGLGAVACATASATYLAVIFHFAEKEFGHEA